MSKDTRLNLKNPIFSREKEVYKNKSNVIFSFGTMVFEVQASMFVHPIIFRASDNIPGSLVNFCFILFTHVLMKELSPMLIHVHKNFHYKVPLSECCCQRISQFLRINFEHICDQVTFRMRLLKK